MKDNQPKTDSEILANVTKEAMLAGGARAPVVFVFDMLHRLQAAYGEKFDIDDACDALDAMIRAAEMAKDELIEARLKEIQ